jgi:hypothetical protein
MPLIDISGVLEQMAHEIAEQAVESILYERERDTFVRAVAGGTPASEVYAEMRRGRITV